jgi:hypothetical protein
MTVHAHPGCSATPPASSGPATRFSYLEIRPMALISLTMSEKVGRSTQVLGFKDVKLEFKDVKLGFKGLKLRALISGFMV